jgi:hypothetical protein
MIHFKLHSLINSVVFVIGLSVKDNSEPLDWSKLGISVTLTTECVNHLIEEKNMNYPSSVSATGFLT